MFAYPSTMCWTCAHLYHKYVYIHRCFKANQKKLMWPKQSTHCTSYRVLNYVLRLLFEKQWQTVKSVCLFHAFWFDAISLRAHFEKLYICINIHRRTNGRKIHLYKRTEEMGLSKKVLLNILFTCKREWRRPKGRGKIAGPALHIPFIWTIVAEITHMLMMLFAQRIRCTSSAQW